MSTSCSSPNQLAEVHSVTQGLQVATVFTKQRQNGSGDQRCLGHGELLEVGAFVASGLQTVLRELGSDVLGRRIVARCACLTASPRRLSQCAYFF